MEDKKVYTPAEIAKIAESRAHEKAIKKAEEDAKILAENYVPIKYDRDTRPSLKELHYMSRASFKSYNEAIKEYEQRLGAYLVMDGTSKEDVYAVQLITFINDLVDEFRSKLDSDTEIDEHYYHNNISTRARIRYNAEQEQKRIDRNTKYNEEAQIEKYTDA